MIPGRMIQGRKEVGEAVATAILTTLATALVTWGVERLKAYVAESKSKGSNGTPEDR